MKIKVPYLLFGLAIIFFVMACYVSYVGASEVYLNSEGSIQAVINAAENGDIIILEPGVYKENINFSGKAITIKSTEPDNPAVVAGTIINGDGAESVVIFENGEGIDSLLIGITLQNGKAHNGGGIYCYYCSPSIIKCIINKNTASEGSGIYCEGASPSITNCNIISNAADYHGGGVYCSDSSSPSIINCTISKNAANDGGGIYCSSSSPNITNCIISGNTADYGGGIRCLFSSPNIINCTVSENSAGDGKGIYCYNSSPSLKNCIFWGDALNEIYIEGGTPNITYSNIKQDSDPYPGIGNINADPMFLRNEQGNYYLRSVSPCINKGTLTDAPLEDKEGIARPQGDTIDIGAYEYIGTTFCMPRASFEANQTRGIDVLTIDFDASSSGASEYDGASFLWDFGDGTNGNGLTASHTYSVFGSFSVNLIMNTQCGNHNLILFDLVKIKSSQVTKEVGDEQTYTSIQKAIDDARYGEIILVYEGTYIENINFKGKEVTVCSANGAATTIIDGDNNGNVVTFNHIEGAESVLDGFTIRHGSASGIKCSFSSPSIINCIISNNVSEDCGGGIYCRYSSPSISNCIVSGNIAEEGSGIYCRYSSPSISNSSIGANTAAGNGSGIYCASSSPNITNCTISNNTSEGYGGGVYCRYSLPNILECAINNNEADYGGGIYCFSSTPNIANCSIISNTANYGGGIRCYSSTANIVNCVIISNITTYYGGGIFCEDSSPTITNCTISGNSSDYCGGIYCCFSSSPSIKNCILWGNTSDEIFVISGAPEVTYSNIQGSYSGEGNINSDPLFIDPNARNYYLKNDSPCIDAGDPNTLHPSKDKDGNPRIINRISDMGAYEYNQFALTIYPGLNLLSLPLGFEQIYSTGSDIWSFFCNQNVNLIKMQAYQANTSSWLTLVGASGNDFFLTPCRAWLAYTYQLEPKTINFCFSSSISIFGQQPYSIPQLFSGLNLINLYSLCEILDINENQLICSDTLFDQLDQKTGKQLTCIISHDAPKGKWQAKYRFFGRAAGIELEIKKEVNMMYTL